MILRAGFPGLNHPSPQAFYWLEHSLVWAWPSPFQEFLDSEFGRSKSPLITSLEMSVPEEYPAKNFPIKCGKVKLPDLENNQLERPVLHELRRSLLPCGAETHKPATALGLLCTEP